MITTNWQKANGNGGAKSLETSFQGRVFRSRLEARFAVSMMNLGEIYAYEPFTFRIDWSEYTPDFAIDRDRHWLSEDRAEDLLTVATAVFEPSSCFDRIKRHLI